MNHLDKFIAQNQNIPLGYACLPFTLEGIISYPNIGEKKKRFYQFVFKMGQAALATFTILEFVKGQSTEMRQGGKFYAGLMCISPILYELNNHVYGKQRALGKDFMEAADLVNTFVARIINTLAAALHQRTRSGNVGALVTVCVYAAINVKVLKEHDYYFR